MLMHEPLRLDHWRLLRTGCDLARHQVANVHVREPGPVLGESAHDVALGDNADEGPTRVADREGPDVERAQARANGGDRFFGNARRKRLAIRFQDVCNPHEEPPLVKVRILHSYAPSTICRRSWSETRPALSEACAPLIMGLV